MWISRTILKTLIILLMATLSQSAVSCPNGDTAGAIKDGKTCSELVADDNAECYDGSFETTCCESCNAVATSNQDCLYGDIDTCFGFLCGSYTDLTNCCDTCSSFITTSAPTSASTASSSTSTTSSSSSTSTSTSVSTASSSTSTTSSSSSTSSSTSVSTTTSGSTSSSSSLLSTDASSTSANTNSSSEDRFDTSKDRSIGGVIAGAVVGSLLGLVVLTVGAWIAIKLLKKKDNKVVDDTSSGIPEKLDKNSVYIHGRMDICTFLQEKLDTSNDPPDNSKTVGKDETFKTNINGPSMTDEIGEPCIYTIPHTEQRDNSNTFAHNKAIAPNTDGKESVAISNNKEPHTGTLHEENQVSSRYKTDIRGHSLPPLLKSSADPLPIHEKLPPVSDSTTSNHSVNAETETEMKNKTFVENNQQSVEQDKIKSVIKDGNLMSNSKSKNVFSSKKSVFLLPEFM